MKNHEKQTVAIPTKILNGVKIGIDSFYLKICQDCGYTEMYSAKVIEKVEKAVKNYK